MIKIIYILWLQGFEEAPEIVKKCYDSWVYYNSDYNIITVDEKNLGNFIDLNEIIPNIHLKNISKTALSNVIRISLLKKYGGFWVDATTFCNNPLSEWVDNYVKLGFFAFENNLISSWFLYSEKNNYIIDKWFIETQKYWLNHHETDDYFWFHHLFEKLHNNDDNFKQLWNNVEKLSSANGAGPHYIQEHGMFSELNKKNSSDIDNKITHLYKLTYKCDYENYKPGTLLYYLLNSLNIINQNSNYTSYNRYNNIFTDIKNYLNNKGIEKILSFGCSSGEEVRSLDDLYFKNKIIHGFDINSSIIQNNIKLCNMTNIAYYDKFNNLKNNEYDIIFCMSVLCNWPNNPKKNYSFELFENTLNLIDLKLNNYGYLVLYNTQYLFNDTNISKKYLSIKLDNCDSGFVTKYTKNFEIIDNLKKDYIFYRKINLLENIIFASYKVSTNNLGDHMQIIANLNLLNRYNIKPEIFIDRDNEIKSIPTYKKDKQILLVMNGWHKTNCIEWIPNRQIIPVFISFHIRLHQCPLLIDDCSIDYYKKYEPIGCRDMYTEELLKKHNIKTFISNCLTLTFPTRDKGIYNKIFISSRCKTILQYLPVEIVNNSEFINHYSDTTDFDTNMNNARLLLENYKNNAKLVVTTFLHCALPCLAMGIPVIVLYPDSLLEISKSDDERFSSLSKIIKIYKYNEINIINWNPPIVDIDNIKKNILVQYDDKLNQLLTK